MAGLLTLILVRHGETDWNATGRYQGRTDIELNDVGIEQARMAAKKWSATHIDAVLASPLKRAHRTAELLVQDRDLRIRLEPAIAETRGGEWESLTFTEIESRWPEEYRNWRNPYFDAGPIGGETPQQSGTRTAEAIATFLAEHPAVKTLLVVSHGNTLRAAAHVLSGAAEEDYVKVPRMANCDAHVMRSDSGKIGSWTLTGTNK